ncbi:MAG: hypothetical protein ABIG95_05830 [Candidatus Woesearchaeota archaeon]
MSERAVGIIIALILLALTVFFFAQVLNIPRRMLERLNPIKEAPTDMASENSFKRLVKEVSKLDEQEAKYKYAVVPYTLGPGYYLVGFNKDDEDNGCISIRDAPEIRKPYSCSRDACLCLCYKTSCSMDMCNRVDVDFFISPHNPHKKLHAGGKLYDFIDILTSEQAYCLAIYGRNGNDYFGSQNVYIEFTEDEGGKRFLYLAKNDSLEDRRLKALKTLIWYEQEHEPGILQHYPVEDVVH